jgi:hypothetical protein
MRLSSGLGKWLGRKPVAADGGPPSVVERPAVPDPTPEQPTAPQAQVRQQLEADLAAQRAKRAQQPRPRP